MRRAYRWGQENTATVAATALGLGLVIAGLLFGVYLRGENTRSHVNILRPQVTRIVKQQAACQPPVTEKRAKVCAARIETGIRLCRAVPSCRAELALATEPPKGGGHSTGHSAPHSQPGPSGGRTAKPKPRAVAPTATPALPPIVSESANAPSPGNSGETPADEHAEGVKACVEIAASACVKADLP